MSNFVIVLGNTGTGKSRSISTLSPKDTVVLNVLGKRLPFKGSAVTYSTSNLNMFKVVDYNAILDILNKISSEDKWKHIKNIIIDDAIYIMRTEFFNRTKEKGFDKFNELGDHFRKIIECGNNLREDLNIFMMLHSESEESEGNILSFKAATVGKLLDKMYNPLENVSIVLFCQPQFNDKGEPKFGFYTHKLRNNGIELPAKSPEGMFKEDFIPNDLNFVVENMNKYYNE